MAKKKLLAEVLSKPGRFYRKPIDVLRDRRFDDLERRKILEAWVRVPDARLLEVQTTLMELCSRDGISHAAE